MRLSLRLANRRSYTYCVPLVEGSHKCTVITHISSSYRHLTLGVTFLTSTDAYCYLDTQCATYHIAYILFSLVLCFGFLLSLDVTYCRYSLSFVRLQVTLRVNFKARVGICLPKSRISDLFSLQLSLRHEIGARPPSVRISSLLICGYQNVFKRTRRP